MAKRYLKEVKVVAGRFVQAEFFDGTVTKSQDATNFWMIMQDKGASLEEVAAYIKMGRQVDAAHEYDEIERILKAQMEASEYAE